MADQKVDEMVHSMAGQLVVRLVDTRAASSVVSTVAMTVVWMAA